MNAVLNLPEITDSTRTEVATAASTALDLEKINLTDLALAKFGDWRGNAATVTANLGSLALDLSTQARVNDAKSLRERLINVPRADARKIAKALKSRLAATSKDIGAAEDQIVAAWDKAETLITPKIEAAQQALDAEKAEKQQIEAARVQVHKDRMATIGAYLTACQAPGMTSERIDRGIAMLAAATFDATWEEFQVPAASLQCETLEAMRTLHAQVLGREHEAARQEAIRLENERQAKALAEERARIDAETAALRKRAAEIEAAERRQREAAEDARVAALAKQRAEEAAAELARIVASAPAPAPVTAERWTDEDPDAATKLPTTEAVERTDPQEADTLATASPTEQATISLGALKDWLGMPSGITREFVEGLGIRPLIDGKAVKFTIAQRRELKAALLRHVEGLQA